mgnify:FL=1
MKQRTRTGGGLARQNSGLKGRFNGFLIGTDIDGTLVDSRGRLSNKNLEAIERFQREGGLFTVATGRMPDYVKTFPFVPNAPVIAINGTVIYELETKNTLWDFPLDRNHTDVFDYLFGKYAALIKDCEAYCFDETVCCANMPYKEMMERFSACSPYKYLFRFHEQEKAAKVNAELAGLFGGRFAFNRSWPFGVEMHNRGSGKGPCLKLLKENFCPGIHTAIGIGNYENDITLMQDADIGFATDNAPEHVKEAADRIAPSNDEDAIAHIIDSLRAL